MKPDRNARVESLFYKVDCILKHLGAESHFTTLIYDSNGHYVANSSIANDVSSARDEFLQSLEPALPVPSRLIYRLHHDLVFLTFIVYPGEDASNENKFLFFVTILVTTFKIR